MLKKVPLKFSSKNPEKSCLITLIKCTALTFLKNTQYWVFFVFTEVKFSTKLCFTYIDFNRNKKKKLGYFH
ncbi:MAG: hypothetical protein C0433_11955 [Cyclobacterium sp.]|nr:hypothetical protein [Cyclobacterium sp.]